MKAKGPELPKKPPAFNTEAKERNLASIDVDIEYGGGYSYE